MKKTDITQLFTEEDFEKNILETKTLQDKEKLERYSKKSKSINFCYSV
jgi:hypothetical protein